eukprot:scaffold180437_cov19-Prasinocladus_malaysianus.AAC.2
MNSSNNPRLWTELSFKVAVKRLRRNDPTLERLKCKKSDGKLQIDPPSSPGDRDQKAERLAIAFFIVTY